MKITHALTAAMLAITLAPSAVQADYQSWASYAIYGRAGNKLFGGAPKKTVTNDPDKRAEVELNDEAHYTQAGGSASGSAQVVAYAKGLSAGFRVSVILSSGNTAPIGGGQASLGAGSGVQAGWQDTLTITERSLPRGAPIRMIGGVRLNGTKNAVVFGANDAYHFGEAAISASISFFALPNRELIQYETGQSYDHSGHQLTSATEPRHELGVDFFVKNGQPFSYEAVLGSAVGGRSSSGWIDTTTPGSVTAFIEGNYSNTMWWSGITSVVDQSSGAALNDWTITSDSGVDYTRSYLVPEPSGLVILGSCLSLVLAKQRRCK